MITSPCNVTMQQQNLMQYNFIFKTFNRGFATSIKLGLELLEL